VPVAVVLERRNELERMLVTHRMYAQMGRELGDPTLLVAGSPVDFQAWGSVRDRMKNRLFNITVRPSFGLDARSLAILLAELRARRHAWVIAYASVFDILCAELEQRGETLRLPHIVPCAELVSDAQRERWRSVLNAEVFEIYGAREMVSIAGETPEHDHLRINSDLYHVEVTDDEGTSLPPGAPGLITITSLVETAMPMIRYQLGDVGVLCADATRDPFPRLKISHGRVLDIIHTPQGKLLPGEFFPHLMKEVHTEVQRFQVEQTDLTKLKVRIVRTPQYKEQTTRYLETKISEQVGPGMELEFEFVSEIATTSSGKYRPTISRIGHRQRLFR
jgi:phenylacetate-CoA ligase